MLIQQKRFSSQTNSTSAPELKAVVDENSVGLLIDNLITNYHNIYTAALREYVSNAVDSHRQAGQSKPVEVTLPSTWGNNELVIEDFGVGMSYEDITEVFINFYSSTKRTSGEDIGGFGIGAKSGLGVNNQIVVTAVKDGLRNVLLYHRDGTTVTPQMMAVNEPTDAPNGVKVQVACDATRAASEYTDKALSYVLGGFSVNEVRVTNNEKANQRLIDAGVRTEHAIIFPFRDQTPHPKDVKRSQMLLLGGVLYEMPVDAGLGYPAKNHLSNTIPVFSASELRMNAAREVIQLTKKTEELLRTRCSEAIEEYLAYLRDYEPVSRADAMRRKYNTTLPRYLDASSDEVAFEGDPVPERLGSIKGCAYTAKASSHRSASGLALTEVSPRTLLSDSAERSNGNALQVPQVVAGVKRLNERKLLHACAIYASKAASQCLEPHTDFERFAVAVSDHLSQSPFNMVMFRPSNEGACDWFSGPVLHADAKVVKEMNRIYREAMQAQRAGEQEKKTGERAGDSKFIRTPSGKKGTNALIDVTIVSGEQNVRRSRLRISDLLNIMDNDEEPLFAGRTPVFFDHHNIPQFLGRYNTDNVYVAVFTHASVGAETSAVIEELFPCSEQAMRAHILETLSKMDAEDVIAALVSDSSTIRVASNQVSNITGAHSLFGRTDEDEMCHMRSELLRYTKNDDTPDVLKDVLSLGSRATKCIRYTCEMARKLELDNTPEEMSLQALKPPFARAMRGVVAEANRVLDTIVKEMEALLTTLRHSSM